MTPETKNEQILTAQVTVALMAVEALIATHPEPKKVRAVFDQIFGQLQAGLVSRGLHPDGLALVRQIVEKTFGPPETL